MKALPFITMMIAIAGHSGITVESTGTQTRCEKNAIRGVHNERLETMLCVAAIHRWADVQATYVARYR